MQNEINNANRLCSACGMCCDGTLFQSATVGPSDEALVAATGLTVNNNQGELSFAQPCKFYCQSQCSIYLKRPPVCINYRCRLLKKLDRGEMELDAALAKVKMVRALQAGLADILPDAGTKPVSAAEVLDVRASIDEADPSQRMQHAVFLMLSTKYIGLIRDDFWRRPKPADVLEAAEADTQEKQQARIILDSYKIQ